MLHRDTTVLCVNSITHNQIEKKNTINLLNVQSGNIRAFEITYETIIFVIAIMYVNIRISFHHAIAATNVHNDCRNTFICILMED